MTVALNALEKDSLFYQAAATLCVGVTWTIKPSWIEGEGGYTGFLLLECRGGPGGPSMLSCQWLRGHCTAEFLTSSCCRI